jgi:hypothetical protein
VPLGLEAKMGRLDRGAPVVGAQRTTARRGRRPRLRGAARARLAILAVLVLLASPVVTYPVIENSLPPAPWPGDGPPD